MAEREELTAAFNPLTHPVCLSAPLRLTPLTAWQEHIPFAMFLVAALRPRILVELGTEAGDSYCAFCQAVEALDLETRCYAVDTWRGDAHAGGYGANVLEELRAHHDPLYGRFSTLIQSTFDEALAHFGDGSIDLLHVDGFHAYESARHDFETWLPKVSRNGVILLHDINVRERGFGVFRLWEEIKRRYPTFEFHHGHGLGVAAAGERAARGLRALFDADEQEAARVRRFFSHLGRRLTLEREYEKRRQAIETLRQQCDARDAELQRLASERSEQAAAVAARDAELRQYGQRLAALQAQLAADRQASLRQIEAAERELRAELEAKEGALSALQAAKADEAVALGERAAKAEGECRRLREEAARAAESSSLQIAGLEDQLHDAAQLRAGRRADAGRAAARRRPLAIHRQRPTVQPARQVARRLDRDHARPRAGTPGRQSRAVICGPRRGLQPARQRRPRRARRRAPRHRALRPGSHRAALRPLRVGGRFSDQAAVPDAHLCT